MKDKVKISSDAKMESYIGIVMRVGVLTAAALMLFGFILLILSTDSDLANFDEINLISIFAGLPSLNPYSYMMLGILMLILTPVIRVISTIVLFAKEKDKLYTAVTILVFVILFVSFLVGLSSR